MIRTAPAALVLLDRLEVARSTSQRLREDCGERAIRQLEERRSSAAAGSCSWSGRSSSGRAAANTQNGVERLAVLTTSGLSDGVGWPTKRVDSLALAPATVHGVLLERASSQMSADSVGQLCAIAARNAAASSPGDTFSARELTDRWIRRQVQRRRCDVVQSLGPPTDLPAYEHVRSHPRRHTEGRRLPGSASMSQSTQSLRRPQRERRIRQDTKERREVLLGSESGLDITHRSVPSRTSVGVERELRLWPP